MKRLALLTMVCLASPVACSDDTTKAPDAKVQADQGTADATAAVDQAVADTMPDRAVADAKACSIVGKWKGSGDGVDFFLEFLANGKVDFTIPTNPTGGGGGTWTLKGDQLDWDTDRTGCDAVPASYTIKFSADCNSVTFTLIKDDCKPRSLATGGKTFPRVP